MKDYIGDVFYCFKISVKMAIIPIVLGIVITVCYLLVQGEAINAVEVAVGVRNTGIIFASLGLFICAAAFIQPAKFTRPLNYEKSWRRYLRKFGLVECILCSSAFVMAYFMILDLVLYSIT